MKMRLGWSALPGANAQRRALSRQPASTQMRSLRTRNKLKLCLRLRSTPHESPLVTRLRQVRSLPIVGRLSLVLLVIDGKVVVAP